MYDELTQVDIDKMKEELEYRITVVRPQILEDVKFARSHGDLSENFEYHAAKRERGLVVISGSLYLVGAAREFLHPDDGSI